MSDEELLSFLESLQTMIDEIDLKIEGFKQVLEEDGRMEW